MVAPPTGPSDIESQLIPLPDAIVAEVERRARVHETPCGDGVMVWRDWGDGKPLVLLHGGHGAWSHWIRNIDALVGAGYNVHVPDLPGWGDSATPPDPKQGPSFAAAVALGLRTILGAEAPLDIVGFSTGGVVGAHVAARQPDLVRRLILVDSGGIDAPVYQAPMQSIRGLVGEALREATLFNLRSLMFHDPASADELALYIQGLNAPRGRARGSDIVLPDHLQQVLPQVRAQVDVIWAENDVLHPDPEAQHAAIRKAQPEAGLRVVPNAGHWVMYEAPAAFNRALVELLAEPPRRLRKPGQGGAG